MKVLYQLKVFTMFYALVSIGVFMALAAKIGAILLEKEQPKGGEARGEEKRSGREGCASFRSRDKHFHLGRRH